MLRLLISAILFVIVSGPQRVLEAVAPSITPAGQLIGDVFNAMVLQWRQQPGLMSVAATCLVLAIAFGLFARSLRQRG